MPTAGPTLGGALHSQSSGWVPAQHRVLFPPKSTSATSYQLHLPLPLSSRCVDGTTLLELSLAVGSQASHLTSLSLGSCRCQIGIMFFSPTL